MITLTRETAEAVVAPRLPRVNLLPREVLEQERFRRVQYGLSGAVLAAAGVVCVLYVAATGATADAQESVREANAEHARLASATAGYREVTTVQARTATAEAALVQAMGQEVRYSRVLDDLATRMPGQVRLASVRLTQTGPGTTGGPGEIGVGQLSGMAGSHDDVSRWLEVLAGQKGFGRPQLESATETRQGDAKVVQWTLRVPLTSAALSDRYRTTGGQ